MIVFVHGVPETDKLWDKLRAEINEESVALSLPGFGCDKPAGFGGTKDDYAEWLTREIDAIGEPVDLVGHDWGAILTFRIATLHGGMLRSWAADVANTVHPEYTWHEFAKTWQTPGEGEAFFEQQSAAPAEVRASIFESMGVPHDDAMAMSSAADERMAESILGLYRSATPRPHADWGGDFGPTKVPGLVLVPTADPFVDETMSQDVADMLGARLERLDGLGHWWPVQDPAAGAAVLEKFWASL